MLREAEDKLLSDLKKEELKIKQTLAEIRIIRNQINEASDEIEDEDFEKISTARNIETQNFQQLENIVTESETARSTNNTTLDDIKNQGLQSYQLDVATRKQSIEQLYDLAYKPIWSKEDSQAFFSIQEATRKANAYDLTTPLQENVSDTYKALQFVERQQKEQIEQAYDPSRAFREAANPIKKQKDLHSLMDSYKPMDNNYKS